MTNLEIHDRLKQLTAEMFDARNYGELVNARDSILELVDELRPKPPCWRRINWRVVGQVAALIAILVGVATPAAVVLGSVVEHAATLGPVARPAVTAIGIAWMYLSLYAVLRLIVNGRPDQ